MAVSVLVLDTCTCIDLYEGELLDRLVYIGDDVFVPDVLLAELTDPPGTVLLQAGLQITILEPRYVVEIEALLEGHPGTSVVDLFALQCARQSSGILVTGDRRLRAAAQQRKVVAHGVLWILDVMIARGVVKPSEAKRALEKMLASGSRLPKQECEKRIARWSER